MKLKFLTICLPQFLLIVLIVCPAPVLAWNSVFLAPSGPNWVAQSVTLGGRAFKLDDYSYCGYKLSQVGLADSIPCNHVTVAASGDVTAALRTAVANLKALGGGYAHIPAGTVTLSGTVTVTGANIDIVGAGSGATTVVIASSYNPSDKLMEAPFTFMGGGGTGYCQWPEPVKSGTKTSCGDVNRGDQSVTVGSAAGLAVGNWVVVQQYFWSSFVSLNSANNWTTSPPGTGTDSAYQQTFCFPRKITAIAGNVITLDAPIAWSLKSANAAVTFYKPIASEILENVGIEALSIKVLTNTNDSGRPAGSALFFKAIFNGWARDVRISNIAQNGIKTAWCSRVTCLDCDISGAQDTGGGGWGYGYYNYASSAVLYKRCSALNLRHNFTDSYAMTNMEVHTQCSSLKTIGNSASVTMENDDTHVCYAQRVLWDSHSMSNNAILEMNRETQSGSDTYETCGGTAVWNCAVTGTNPFGTWQAGTVQCSPATYTTDSDGFVVGVSAGATVYDGAEDMDAGWVTGTKMTGAATQVGPRKNVAYEGLNVTGLSPSSLFDAQLQTRLGSLPPDSAPSTCVAAGTPTNTATKTATNTVTNTATVTSTSTATRTPTNTSTNTIGNTSTNTATATATNTATATPTKTPTPTTTNTYTNSATSTSTNSATRTATATSTSTTGNTGTNTPTNTATSTATNTATNTATKTVTSTATNTSTNTTGNTATNTPTNSATATPTKTATPTATSTSTNSATNTSTNTTGNTATNTPTKTATPSATNTMTSTSTNTTGNTATNTSTSTSTNTVTNTMTKTVTNTSTSTSTNTATKTVTATTTNTSTNTSGNTSTSTATSTSTNTATNTKTNTSTATATNSPTMTATKTATSTATDSATGTLVPTNTFTMTATNTETNTATHTPTTTSTHTPTSTATHTPTNSMTPTLPDTATSTAASTSTSTSTATSSNTATNTPANTVTSTATVTSTNTTGNTATPTSTNTTTNTSTKTSTSTATNTATSTATQTTVNTATSTASNTPTNTVVSTSTSTATETVTSTPKHHKKGTTVYPNPATGDTTTLQTGFDSTSDVTVQVFTIAFRKVQETTYTQVAPDSSIALALVDKTGATLANGIYYVVLETPSERTTTKLLILR